MSNFPNATLAEQAKRPNVLPDRHVFVIAALFLLAIATGLRVYHLGDRSLWSDEAQTAVTSRGTFTQMLEETRSRGSQPLAHPFLLYLVEKVGHGPVAVRVPSVLTSLLAVLLMLGMIYVKVSPNAALFAAAIFAVSASQIRYAQEVREYSFSVLFAAIMVFCLLRWEAGKPSRGHPVLLYAALFFAPFIQYGLVLLALAILSTMGLRLLLTRGSRFRLHHAVIASAFLGAGGLLSLALTLRYQFDGKAQFWYLAANYFDPKTMTLLGFLGSNTKSLLIFVIAGRVIRICFLIGAVIYCIAQVRARKYETLTLLVFTSVLITMCAAVAKFYPFGGIRQCLFLAPVITLFAGVVLADLLQRVKAFRRPLVTIGFMILILASGYRSMRMTAGPWAEVEDIQAVLKTLKRLRAPNDQVYVFYGAAPAVDFYTPARDGGLAYGKVHRDAPQEYASELHALIDQRTDRFWLVFSHLTAPIFVSEQQLILDSLRPEWDVARVVAATGTALYVANRKTSPLEMSVKPQKLRASRAAQSSPPDRP